MWDFYYNSFCAALASLTASLVYRSVADEKYPKGLLDEEVVEI
jgi:hypothetical protein